MDDLRQASAEVSGVAVWSSAVQAVMDAAVAVNDLVCTDSIAAALRATADQVAPSDADEPRNYLPMAIECQRIRAEILAIAAELEGSNG
jgi:hypothetical protein